MPFCAINWCKKKSHTSNYTTDGVTFHRFPKSPTRKEKWIEIAGKPDTWFPTKHSSICSTHFEDDCFYAHGTTRRIYDTAIPTLNLPALVSRIREPNSDQIINEVDNDEGDKLITTVRRIRGGGRFKNPKVVMNQQPKPIAPRLTPDVINTLQQMAPKLEPGRLVPIDFNELLTKSQPDLWNTMISVSDLQQKINKPVSTTINTFLESTTSTALKNKTETIISYKRLRISKPVPITKNPSLEVTTSTNTNNVDFNNLILKTEPETTISDIQHTSPCKPVTTTMNTFSEATTSTTTENTNNLDYDDLILKKKPETIMAYMSHSTSISNPVTTTMNTFTTTTSENSNNLDYNGLIMKKEPETIIYDMSHSLSKPVTTTMNASLEATTSTSENTHNVDICLRGPSRPEFTSTPVPPEFRERKLKREIIHLKVKVGDKNKYIKRLQSQNRCLKQKVAELKKVIESLVMIKK